MLLPLPDSDALAVIVDKLQDIPQAITFADKVSAAVAGHAPVDDVYSEPTN